MKNTNANERRLLSQSDPTKSKRLVTAVNDWAVASRKAHEQSYEFMEKVEDLDFAIAGLDRSCRKYLWRLGQIKTQPLGARCRRLIWMMDGYLTSHAF